MTAGRLERRYFLPQAGKSTSGKKIYSCSEPPLEGAEWERAESVQCRGEKKIKKKKRKIPDVFLAGRNLLFLC